jgi:hypothetical protein
MTFRVSMTWTSGRRHAVYESYVGGPESGPLAPWPGRLSDA